MGTWQGPLHSPSPTSNRRAVEQRHWPLAMLTKMGLCLMPVSFPAPPPQLLNVLQKENAQRLGPRPARTAEKKSASVRVHPVLAVVAPPAPAQLTQHSPKTCASAVLDTLKHGALCYKYTFPPLHLAAERVAL